MLPSANEETRVQTLVTVHSWVRWLVLLALVSGVVVSLLRYRSGAKWSESVFQLGVMTVDIQVVIGIVIWIESKGWNQSGGWPECFSRTEALDARLSRRNRVGVSARL